MSVPKLGSLVVENQDGPADRDAAAVLDPDTFVVGAPFDALARLRADAPVHPVQLSGLPRAWLLTKHADVRMVSRDTETFTSSKSNTLVEVEAGPTSAMLPLCTPLVHTNRFWPSVCLAKRTPARSWLKKLLKSYVKSSCENRSFAAYGSFA